jgi:hypothetical protein
VRAARGATGCAGPGSSRGTWARGSSGGESLRPRGDPGVIALPSRARVACRARRTARAGAAMTSRSTEHDGARCWSAAGPRRSPDGESDPKNHGEEVAVSATACHRSRGRRVRYCCREADKSDYGGELVSGVSPASIVVISWFELSHCLRIGLSGEARSRHAVAACRAAPNSARAASSRAARYACNSSASERMKDGMAVWLAAMNSRAKSSWICATSRRCAAAVLSVEPAE